MKFYDETSNQTVNFEIPENYKKVAVNCSGGADSSILVLLTATYLKEQGREDDVSISVLTCSNDKKSRWNGRKAADVIDYVIRKTGYTNFDMHYTYYRDVQDVKYFHEVERKLIDDGAVEFLLNGVTANPPEGSFVENSKGELIDLWDERLPIRDRNDKPEVYKTFYSPFLNIDKRMVAHLYSALDAEDLLDLTRSCEALPDENHYDKNFEYTPCGECWWCLERKWAFGKF